MEKNFIRNKRRERERESEETSGEENPRSLLKLITRDFYSKDQKAVEMMTKRKMRGEKFFFTFFLLENSPVFQF